MASERYLRATIAGHEIGLPIDAVGTLVRCENVQYSPIAKGPLGWLLEPKETELWQLHRAFGAEPPIHRGLPAVELIDDAVSRALVVDSLGAVAELDSSQIFPPPALLQGGERALLSGVGIFDGQPLPLVDPVAIPAYSTAPVELSWQPTQPVEPLDLPGEAASAGRPRPMNALQVTLSAPGSIDHRSLAAILSLSQVRTLGSRLSRLPVPGAPPFVAGLAVWNGRPATWIDLPRLLGVVAPGLDPDSGRHVILETALGGLLVLGGIVEVETLEADTTIDALEAQSSFPRGLLLLEGIRGDSVVVVPDFDAVASMRPVGALAQPIV